MERRKKTNNKNMYKLFRCELKLVMNETHSSTAKLWQQNTVYTINTYNQGKKDTHQIMSNGTTTMTTTTTPKHEVILNILRGII